MRLSGACEYAFEIVSTSFGSLMQDRVGVNARMMLRERSSLYIILLNHYTVLYPPLATSDVYLSYKPSDSDVTLLMSEISLI